MRKRFISRRVPTFSLTVERPVPSTDDAPDFCTLEVECEMDDGAVYSATVVDREYDGQWEKRSDLITLTRDEREGVEVDFSDSERDREDAAREDAADARREMERGL